MAIAKDFIKSYKVYITSQYIGDNIWTLRKDNKVHIKKAIKLRELWRRNLEREHILWEAEIYDIFFNMKS